MTYTVKPNGKFTRFLATPIEIEKVAVDKTIMTSEIARVEDYFDVEYPVRSKFLLENDINQVPYQSQGFQNIYTPFERDRVDYSSFISTPHKLYSYVKTTLSIQEAKQYLFAVRTCGGLIIWVNGVKQFSYAPYTRNHYTEAEISLTLEEGDNEIVIYFEDLAERDVSYYFELINKNDQEIQGFIELDMDLDYYKKIEKLLQNAYLEKDLFTNGDVRIQFIENDFNTELPITIRVNPRLSLVNDGAQDGNITDFEIDDIKRTIQPGDLSLFIGAVEDIQTAGFTRLELSIPVTETFTLKRTLTCSIYDENKFNPIIQGNTLSERKKEALNYYAQLELEDINVALVNAALDQIKETDIYQEYLSAFKLIEEKGDCADFILAPLLAVYSQYEQNFPEDFHEKMRSLATDFRYWIDEPGNDVMWYFSENHALLFHVSQYLAGHLYPDETFIVSERLGNEQYKIGKERLENWFDKFFEVGFSEWNSTTYFPIDFIGFFSLYLAAPDKHIKELAIKALDYTFSLIALNYHGGTMASTFGRVYEHNLKAMKLGEISSIIQIAWKNGYFNNSLRAGALFALTDYVPPIDLMNDMEIEEGQALTAEYLQGDNQALTYLYKRKDYSIASVIDYKSYLRGHQQHVVNVSLGGATMLWVNNPGEAEFSGGNRPSYWAGNDVMPRTFQYENTVFMHYDLKNTDYRFIHLYLPFWDLDEIIEKEKWFFARKGTAYVAVYFEKGYKRIYESSVYGREVRSEGENQYVIIQASSQEESNSFERFIEEMMNHQVMVSHEELKVQKPNNETFVMNQLLYRNNQAIDYSKSYELKINKK